MGDNEKSCCLVTSIPRTRFAASEVVKAYYDQSKIVLAKFAIFLYQ